MPPATGLAEAVLVSETSARTWVVEDALAALFAGFGSVVVAETVAVFVTSPLPPAGVFAVNATVRDAPLSRAPTGQVTVLAATVHPSGLDAKVSPAGRGSLMVAPTARDGPLLRTVSV